VPCEFIHLNKQSNASAESDLALEQQCSVAPIRERVRKGTGVSGVHAPLTPVRRDASDDIAAGKA